MTDCTFHCFDTDLVNMDLKNMNVKNGEKINIISYNETLLFYYEKCYILVANIPDLHISPGHAMKSSL